MAAVEVRIDYEEMKALRSISEEQREKAQQLLRRVSDQVDVLKSDNWIGQNADAFYKEMDGDVIPALERLVRAFASMEATCDSLMSLFEAAEDEMQGFFPKA